MGEEGRMDEEDGRGWEIEARGEGGVRGARTRLNITVEIEQG